MGNATVSNEKKLSTQEITDDVCFIPADLHIIQAQHLKLPFLNQSQQTSGLEIQGQWGWEHHRLGGDG